MANISFPHIFLLIFLPFHLSLFASCEEQIPKGDGPFQNLIPRFKMPRGNLLRYQIPQWEVLYFLKYGIVPFMFYDPNFNKTSFVSQLLKFKMYFDEGKENRPNRTVQDEEAFKELLKSHGYPYNQLPDNALSRNNKMVEEINGMLEAVSRAPEKVEPTSFPPLDVFMANLYQGKTESRTKKGNPNPPDEEIERFRQNLLNLFINRFPLTLGINPHDFLLNNRRSHLIKYIPYTPRQYFAWNLRRNAKSMFRVGTRNANDGNSGDSGRSGAANGDKKGKNFQTQGWR